MSKGFWISTEMTEKILELNYLMVQYNSTGSGAINFAKINYKKIAELRDSIEKIHAVDMLNLYDVKYFLNKSKRLPSEFIEVKLLKNDNKST